MRLGTHGTGPHPLRYTPRRRLPPAILPRLGLPRITSDSQDRQPRIGSDYLGDLPARRPASEPIRGDPNQSEPPATFIEFSAEMFWTHMAPRSTFDPQPAGLGYATTYTRAAVGHMQSQTSRTRSGQRKFASRFAVHPCPVARHLPGLSEVSLTPSLPFYV